MDSILCTESVKYLYINAFKHVIQSTTKNKSRYVRRRLGHEFTSGHYVQKCTKGGFYEENMRE